MARGLQFILQGYTPFFQISQNEIMKDYLLIIILILAPLQFYLPLFLEGGREEQRVRERKGEKSKVVL